MSPGERAALEQEVEALRVRRANTLDDRLHDALGRQLDEICDRLAAPEGFDTLAEFNDLDRLMRQPPR